MRRVAFLPEKLRSAQEKRRAFLPAHNIVPLVHQYRQVTIALNPLCEAVTDDGFTGWPDGKRLLQLLAATACHPRHFWREALDVFRLLLKEAAWDQQGEVGIHHARFLEARIQQVLDIF